MSQPSIATVTIDDVKFKSLSASLRLVTPEDFTGRPQIGAHHTNIDIIVDAHDNQNLPFANLKRLYELSRHVTEEAIVDMKIECWTDDSAQDTICVWKFRGWISHFQLHTGHGNHELHLGLHPALKSDQTLDLEMTN